MSNSLELVIKKLFITYDTDNSGALDREELSNLLNDMCQHLGLEECGQREMAKIILIVDESGDGEVDFPELVHHVGRVVEAL
jgi:Ca2+-binding EF-hand superfamily protein